MGRKVPRSGTNFVNSKGTAVSREAHMMTVRKGQSGNAVIGHTKKDGKGREKRDDVKDSLLAVVSEPETPEVFVPSRKVKNRFDLGEPIATKPAALDTIIGRVEFTDDLVAGFEDDVPPQNTKEMWGMMEEAALRYAKLTAFIMAEQDLNAAEMGKKLGRKGQDYEWLDPRDVIKAAEMQNKLNNEEDLPLDERVILSLDPDKDKDSKSVVLKAADQYRLYISDNSRELSEYNRKGGDQKTQILEQTISSVRNNYQIRHYGFTPRNLSQAMTEPRTCARLARDTLRMDLIDRYRQDIDSLKPDDVDLDGLWLRSDSGRAVWHLGEQNEGELQDYARGAFPGDPGRPFVEDEPTGFRVNLEKGKYLRFGVAGADQDGSPAYVMRCVEEDGKEVNLSVALVPTKGIDSDYVITKSYEVYADFSRPIFSTKLPFVPM